MSGRSEALRDLAFVLLGVEADLLRRDGLAAALQAWRNDPGRPLVEVFIERGVLYPNDLSALEARVDSFLAAGAVDVVPNAELPTVGADGEPRLHDTLPTTPDMELTQPADGVTMPMDGGAAAWVPPGPADADGASRFKVIAEHAKGGLGVVFRALDTELNREVALKQMQVRHADNPSSRSRFLLEAEVTGGLEHPGIVPVYALGVDGDGRPYYAMRFIRGDSLKDAIEAFHADPALLHDAGRRSLELRKLLRRFLDVCNTIDFAHGRGVLHRDIKPANIMVGKHGETLVVDWGIAKVGGQPDLLHDSGDCVLFAKAHTGATETLPGSAMGTPAYMSPEQAEGALDRLSPASDVYSLGATLYCLLTGRPPFEDADLARILRRVKAGDFAPPRKVDRSIPAALEAVCLKAMSREPVDRYASARLLAEDVERWMADEPVTARRDPFVERARRWMRRRRTAVTAAAAAVLVAMIGLVVVLGVQQKANHELWLAKEREHARFDLALEAIRTFHTGVSGDFLLQQKEFKDQRNNLLTTARDFYRKLEVQLVGETDRPSRRALGQSYYAVGDLTSRISEKKEALVPHRRALEIREALASGSEASDADRDDLAASLAAIAAIELEMSNKEEATSLLDRALVLREELVARNPDSIDDRRDLAWCYHLMGDFEMQKVGQQEVALESYAKARAIRLNLVNQWPDDPRLQFDLAASYNTIGRLLTLLGRQEEGMADLRRALEIRERLVKDYPDASEYRDSLARSYHNVANDLAYRGTSEDLAIEAFRKALALREELVKAYPAVSRLQTQLAAVASDMAGSLVRAGKIDDGLALFRRSRDIELKLLDANPHVTMLARNLSLSDISIGMIHEEQGRPEEALASFEAARKRLQSLVDADPDNPDFRYQLAGCNAHLGRLLAAWGRVNEALGAFDRRVDDLRVLAAASPRDVNVRRDLPAARADRADLLASQGQFTEALREFDQAVVAQTALAAADPKDPGAQQALVASRERRALVLAHQGHAPAALAPLQEVARMRTQMLRERPNDPQLLQADAEGQGILGETLLLAGRSSEAVSTLRNAMAATDRQVEQNPGNHRLALALARVVKQLGDALRANHQPAEAAAAYRQAIRVLATRDVRNAGDQEWLAALHASLAQLAGAPDSGVAPADGPTERDLALASLRSAVAAGFRDLVLVRERPEYEPLKSRTDFQDILADLAFPIDPFLPPRAHADDTLTGRFSPP